MTLDQPGKKQKKKFVRKTLIPPGLTPSCIRKLSSLESDLRTSFQPYVKLEDLPMNIKKQISMYNTYSYKSHIDVPMQSVENYKISPRKEEEEKFNCEEAKCEGSITRCEEVSKCSGDMKKCEEKEMNCEEKTISKSCYVENCKISPRKGEKAKFNCEEAKCEGSITKCEEMSKCGGDMEKREVKEMDCEEKEMNCEEKTISKSCYVENRKISPRKGEEAKFNCEEAKCKGSITKCEEMSKCGGDMGKREEKDMDCEEKEMDCEEKTSSKSYVENYKISPRKGEEAKFNCEEAKCKGSITKCQEMSKCGGDMEKREEKEMNCEEKTISKSCSEISRIDDPQTNNNSDDYNCDGKKSSHEINLCRDKEMLGQGDTHGHVDQKSPPTFSFETKTDYDVIDDIRILSFDSRHSLHTHIAKLESPAVAIDSPGKKHESDLQMEDYLQNISGTSLCKLLNLRKRKASKDSFHWRKSCADKQTRKLSKSMKFVAQDDDQPKKGKIYGWRNDGRFATKRNFNTVSKKKLELPNRPIYEKSSENNSMVDGDSSSTINCEENVNEKDDREKWCGKAECKNLCICHLIHPAEDLSYDIDLPLPADKCLKDYCRLGCLCSSLRYGARKKNDEKYERKDHCGEHSCIFGCVCKVETRAVRKARMVLNPKFDDHVNIDDDKVFNQLVSSKEDRVEKKKCGKEEMDSTSKKVEANDNSQHHSSPLLKSSPRQVKKKGPFKSAKSVQSKSRKSPVPAHKSDPVMDNKKPLKLQMVLVQRKRPPGCTVHLPSTPHLLEIHSNCNWDHIRANILSKVSFLTGSLDYPPLSTFSMDKFTINILQRGKNPTIIPPHLRAVLKTKSMFPIRIQISDSATTSFVVNLGQMHSLAQDHPLHTNQSTESKITASKHGNGTFQHKLMRHTEPIRKEQSSVKDLPNNILQQMLTTNAGRSIEDPIDLCDDDKPIDNYSDKSTNEKLGSRTQTQSLHFF